MLHQGPRMVYMHVHSISKLNQDTDSGLMGEKFHTML